MGDHESQSLERRRQALQRFQEKQASRATTTTTASTTTSTPVVSDPSKENISNNPILTKEKGEGVADIKNEVIGRSLSASRRDSAARTMRALAQSRSQKALEVERTNPKREEESRSDSDEDKKENPPAKSNPPANRKEQFLSNFRNLRRMRSQMNRGDIAEAAASSKTTAAKNASEEEDEKEMEETRAFRRPVMMMKRIGGDPSKLLPKCVVDTLHKTLPLDLGLRPLMSAAGDEKLKQKVESIRDQINETQNVIAVKVIGTDSLGSRPEVVHPMVRVHVVDGSTGRYVRHSSEGQESNVSKAEEGVRKTVIEPVAPSSFIIPLTTKPYPLIGKEHTPKWDQVLLFDEPYRILAGPDVLLLFEMIDYSAQLSLNKSKQKMRVDTVAWGFLRTVSSFGQPNFQLGAKEGRGKGEGIVNIQLYEHQDLGPLARMQATVRGLYDAAENGKVPAVYLQYLLQKRRRLMTGMQVSVFPVKRPAYETRQALQKAQNVRLFSGGGNHESEAQRAERSGEKGVPISSLLQRVPLLGSLNISSTSFLRTRGRYDHCLLPNKLLFRLSVGTHGAMCLSFSNNGKYLAVGCCFDHIYSVRIFDPETGALLHDLKAVHYSVIYEVHWAEDDRYLISASGDGTCNIWMISKHATQSNREVEEDENDGEEVESKDHSPARTLKMQKTAPIEEDTSPFLPIHITTLQHKPPCYIYCALLITCKGDTGQIAITGAFDRSLRMWDGLKGVELGLLGGSITHEGHVNAITADRRTGRLYSGDSVGVILVWKKQGDGVRPGDYSVLHRIRSLDFIDKGITSLSIHPTRRKGQLLIQAHHHCLKLMDLYTYKFVHGGYPGVRCHKSKIKATFSPDGRYVVAGSDDGRLRAWETQNGRNVSDSLSSLCFPQALCDVTWHPTQHVIAIAAYGENMPVLMYYAEHSEGDQAEPFLDSNTEGPEPDGPIKGGGDALTSRRGSSEPYVASAEPDHGKKWERLKELRRKWVDH